MRHNGLGWGPLAAALLLAATPCIGQDEVMSEAYRQLWNAEEQARIDRDIERYRMADGHFELGNLPEGTKVQVEQVTHDFVFGAHIFNFNQLGTSERNRKYKALYGSLFNSATIAFYWKTFEPEPGRPRFQESEQDTETYWNSVADPKSQPHWRRPAPDPVVAFCEAQGIRLHGHPIIWGNRRWHHPEWLFEQYAPPAEKTKILELGAEGLQKLTPAEIAELAPVYTKELRRLFDQRVVELARHYQGRIHSWDVVNESATDFSRNLLNPSDPICQSTYGLMPGDYTFHAFQLAQREFPEHVLLNINDYLNNAAYTNQSLDLRRRGCRVDVLGSQMHLFNPQQCLDIAAGKPIETPEIVRNKMATLAKAKLPIHLSEITITAPGDDARGRQIQAVIARNLYRLWFSIEPMMGITWWNVVDDCGAPGEPTTSGLFTRDVEPKPAFHALDQLINHEWKTHTTLQTDPNGGIRFRGFKGRYTLTWTSPDGTAQERTVHLGATTDR